MVTNMANTEKDSPAVVDDSRETPEEFLRRGGSIKTVTRGATGEDGSTFRWNASRYPARRKMNGSNSAIECMPTNNNKPDNGANPQKP